MTVNTIIETDRVCDVAILQEAWRGRCAEPERYHSVVCQVFRGVRVSLCRSLLLKMLKRTRWKAVTRLRSAWRTAETTASAGGHGMRNDDKTHGPGARGAGAVYNWLRRHAGCNVLAEVSHIELSHVRTVVFSGRQRQRSFHDRRRAPSLHSAVGQLFGRLLVVYHRQISRFTAFSEVWKETEGRRATPSPGLLAAGGQNAKVPAVRAAGGALPGRRHASPRQRRRDSRTVNCQHNRGKAPSPRTLRRTPLSVGKKERRTSRVRAGRRGLHCGG